MPSRVQARHRTPAPVSDSLKRVGDRIRQARTEAGLSQAQLGRPHFTRAYVSALELGKIRPAMKSLEFLAGKLGKPVAHFVEDEEQERRRQERDVKVSRAGQLISEGRATEAIAELEAIVDESLPHVDRLAIKRTLGRALIEAAQPARAAAILEEVVQGYQALADEEQVARTRAQLGRALIGLMSYDEAEEHLALALRALASGVIRDPLLRVHVLHNLGVSQYHRGNYKAALEHFERAAQEGQDVADPKWLASLYAGMGMSRRQVGDLESAVTWLRKSEVLFESLNNRVRVAEIRFQAGRTLRSLGNRSRASEVLTQAGEEARACGEIALLARIEVFASQAQLEDGDPQGAISRLAALLSTIEAVEDPRVVFAARFVLARAHIDVDIERAEAMLRELATPGGAKSDLADVYSVLSTVLARQGKADEALVFAQRAYVAGLDSKKGGD